MTKQKDHTSHRSSLLNPSSTRRSSTSSRTSSKVTAGEKRHSTTSSSSSSSRLEQVRASAGEESKSGPRSSEVESGSIDELRERQKRKRRKKQKELEQYIASLGEDDHVNYQPGFGGSAYGGGPLQGSGNEFTDLMADTDFDLFDPRGQAWQGSRTSDSDTHSYGSGSADGSS